MTKQELAELLEEKVNAASKQQGINHANPVIRSMYPSKSRGEMAKEFEQVHSVGANLFLPLLAEAIDMLQCKNAILAITVGGVSHFGHDNDCPKCALIQKIKEM